MRKSPLKVLAAAGLAALVGVASLSALAQAGPRASAAAVTAKPHRIVIEVSVAGPEAYPAILNNVENLQKAFGPKNVEIEVVGHGKGLSMMLAQNEKALVDRMSKDAASGVVFAACSNTMRRQNVERAQLLSFATVVDSGVAEVVRKQEAGWSYLKGGG